MKRNAILTLLFVLLTLSCIAKPKKVDVVMIKNEGGVVKGKLIMPYSFNYSKPEFCEMQSGINIILKNGTVKFYSVYEIKEFKFMFRGIEYFMEKKYFRYSERKSWSYRGWHLVRRISDGPTKIYGWERIGYNEGKKYFVEHPAISIDGRDNDTIIMVYGKHILSEMKNVFECYPQMKEEYIKMAKHSFSFNSRSFAADLANAMANYQCDTTEYDIELPAQITDTVFKEQLLTRLDSVEEFEVYIYSAISNKKMAILKTTEDVMGFDPYAKKGFLKKNEFKYPAEEYNWIIYYKINVDNEVKEVIRVGKFKLIHPE